MTDRKQSRTKAESRMTWTPTDLVVTHSPKKNDERRHRIAAAVKRLKD